MKIGEQIIALAHNNNFTQILTNLGLVENKDFGKAVIDKASKIVEYYDLTLFEIQKQVKTRMRIYPYSMSKCCKEMDNSFVNFNTSYFLIGLILLLFYNN